MSIARRISTRVAGWPARTRRRIREFAATATATPLISCRVRVRLQSVLLGHDVVGCRMYPYVRLIGSGHLTAGNGSFINSDCLLDLSDTIVLGDHVHLGPRVCIYTSSHAIGPASCRAGIVETNAVRVGPGTWIGANAVVLAGVSIAGGCVIGAGALVHVDIDDPGLYVGVPVRKIRDLP